MSALKLQVITPDGLQLDTEADEVALPGNLGQFGVLPGHVPFVSALDSGVVSYRSGTQTRLVAVNGGYSRVQDGVVMILSDGFATAETQDKAALLAELRTVDDELEAYGDELDSDAFAQLLRREVWAAARLELTGQAAPPRNRVLSEFQVRQREADRLLASVEQS